MADESNHASRAAEVVRRWWLLALLVVAAVPPAAGVGWPAGRDWHEQSVSQSKTGRPATLLRNCPLDELAGRAGDEIESEVGRPLT
jgi:hypothetical protein